VCYNIRSICRYKNIQRVGNSLPITQKLSNRRNIMNEINEIVVSEYAKKRMVELESRRVDGGYLDTTEWGQEEWDAFDLANMLMDIESGKL